MSDEPTNQATQQDPPATGGNQQTQTQNGQGTQGANSQGQQQQQQTPANFDDWLKGQSDDVKDLIDDRFANLESALKSERTERKNLMNQLKDLSDRAGKGSDFQKQLDAVTAKLEQAERQADFYREAAVAGVIGNNIKLAWLAAQEHLEEHTIRGKLNFTGLFAAMKTDYPNLFKTTTAPPPPGNAGAGTGNNQPPPAMDMNQLILKRARGAR